METTDIVIVGAGIGGAVLALALARRGWRVTLLERETEPPTMARPEVLWGATPAALDQFGIGEPIRTQASVRLAGVEARQRSRRLLSLSRRVIDSARVEAYSTDPGRTRTMIAEAALATDNVTVLRGVHVTGVLRDRGRIVGVQGTRQGATLEAHARLIVGDDGAKSIVRSSFDAPLKAAVFPLDFITAIVDWPDELAPDQVHVWLKPEAFRGGGIPALGLFPWPGRRGVVLMPLPHERIAPLFDSPAAAFWSQIATLTPLAGWLQSQRRFPDDFKHVRRPYGHAPQYVADGAAIIGDAAHPMSPAGGQGANASIWDALALADVAHEALSADDLSRQRLLTYEALRRPRNAASVRLTELAVTAFRFLPSVPALSRLVPAALGMLDNLPWVKARILSTAATTFVT